MSLSIQLQGNHEWASPPDEGKVNIVDQPERIRLGNIPYSIDQTESPAVLRSCLRGMHATVLLSLIKIGKGDDEMEYRYSPSGR